jgi:uncharacterized protein (DUF305 family)
MIHTFTARRTLLAGAAALTTLGLAAACDGSDGMDHRSGQPMTSASVDIAFNDADVTFAQMMIPHHQQAVEMARLAETRASDPEVKQLATTIKTAQAPEITTMTGWLTGWGQPTAQPGGHNMPGMSEMPGMMSEAEIAQLTAATGVDFDRMFARMMIAHHNGAIQMCRDMMANGSNAQAKALATTIEQTQTAEVATLQAILDRL